MKIIETEGRLQATEKINLSDFAPGDTNWASCVGTNYFDTVDKLIESDIKSVTIHRDWPYEEILEEVKYINKDDWLIKSRLELPIYAYALDPTLCFSKTKLSYLGYKDPDVFAFTQYAEKIPTLVDWVSNDPMYKRLGRISLQLIGPSKELTYHTDVARDRMATINYMLQDNSSVFVIGDKSYTIGAGNAHWFDTQTLHGAVNHGPDDRINILQGSVRNEENWYQLLSQNV